ncbi:MAG: photosynthetic reaction center cytochrome PufC [Beijerinckiaceae bacterium]
MSRFLSRKAGALAALLFAGVLAGCEAPPQESTQNGYRGTGMNQIFSPERLEALKAANVVPEAQPPADASGPRASQVYQNVQVLGHLSEGEFLRIMTAITEWVSPEQGCAYCHNVENLADESMYTKKVARRMLQMTQRINTDWTSHVAQTGVTCYTCHRGQPVPQNIWFKDTGHVAAGSAADPMGQNTPLKATAYTSLPRDPLSALLTSKANIRVAGTGALSSDAPGASIIATETTYSLMNHMSQSLGVNCTFCHNTRSFGSWTQSPPQRVTAWHGIALARDINTAYLDPLKATYPAERLGPEGDAAKASCATCHQGVNKPLYGVSMLKDYLKELSAPKP